MTFTSFASVIFIIIIIKFCTHYVTVIGIAQHYYVHQKQSLIHDHAQNRRQKVFNKGALRLCRGGLTYKLDKNSTNLSCFIFQFRGLGDLFGGANTAKAPPLRRDWPCRQLASSKKNDRLCEE